MPADPAALAAELGRLGMACDVETEGALAIVVPHAPSAAPSVEQRSEIVRLARRAGFANVALELRGRGPAPRRRDS